MKNITQPAIQTQANIPAWALNVYRWIGVCVYVCVCVFERLEIVEGDKSIANN